MCTTNLFSIRIQPLSYHNKYIICYDNWNLQFTIYNQYIWVWQNTLLSLTQRGVQFFLVSFVSFFPIKIRVIISIPYVHFGLLWFLTFIVFITRHNCFYIPYLTCTNAQFFSRPTSYNLLAGHLSCMWRPISRAVVTSHNSHGLNKVKFS